MELTLHTHDAARIWQGRPAGEEKNGIIGLSGFVSLMNKIKRGAEQDDPYADLWMIRIHEKLEHSKDALTLIRDRLDELMGGLPSAIQVGENLNVHPVTVPLYVNTPLGFLAVYLLIDYDDIVRRLRLANHTALMGRRDMERWIDAGGHVLRSLFGLAQQFKFSGVTREDFVTNNSTAREAQERFGELPTDVLEGTRRSEFAPQIIRRRAGEEGRLEAIEGASEAGVAEGDSRVFSLAGSTEETMGSERLGG